MFLIFFLKNPKIAKINENLKNMFFDIFASFLAFSASSLSHVCGVTMNISLSSKYLEIEKYREIRNSYFLSVRKWNESRHLVFWSLGTLTRFKTVPGITSMVLASQLELVPDEEWWL